jgi:UPF0176 protein
MEFFTMFSVTQFYSFTPVADVESFRLEQEALARALELTGRIYVAEEGINGTAAGTSENIRSYEDALHAIPGFEDMLFKTDEVPHIPFDRLKVKIRPEIVALKAPDKLDPKNAGGRHLKPSEWRQVLESEKDYVLIDVRNNYESKIGHFEGAVLPDLENFYDFPQWLEQSGIPKDKKVLMYCTGGIRCEKFSALMIARGWNDVNQLHGGILQYAKEENGAHFRGKCFVFDDRMAVPINPESSEPVGTCDITGQPADKIINCANMDCNKLFVCCEEGIDKYHGCCSEACMHAPRVRPWKQREAFAPFRRWYNYFGPEFKQHRHSGEAGAPVQG